MKVNELFIKGIELLDEGIEWLVELFLKKDYFYKV